MDTTVHRQDNSWTQQFIDTISIGTMSTEVTFHRLTVHRRPFIDTTIHRHNNSKTHQSIDTTIFRHNNNGHNEQRNDI